ncbi:Hypothetical_protein [Hexamita inflata]|uniref:Hypothetical_protein n=1 Tax=Hexamita inflata TaxID=28002 RepID=A0AA86TQL6_9EUKA|nr:Hypothetical protein HINF_LOCUS12691 [Hexamita inflata]CAI9968237.1 Hypothetical protein HINF_LOCUS55882 [Hexamita inflata]
MKLKHIDNDAKQILSGSGGNKGWNNLLVPMHSEVSHQLKSTFTKCLHAKNQSVVSIRFAKTNSLPNNKQNHNPYQLLPKRSQIVNNNKNWVMARWKQNFKICVLAITIFYYIEMGVRSRVQRVAMVIMQRQLGEPHTLGAGGSNCDRFQARNIAAKTSGKASHAKLKLER